LCILSSTHSPHLVIYCYLETIINENSFIMLGK
jgi:hypothetical protein